MDSSASRWYAGANHPSVKRGNRAAIFRAIYELAPIARVDLAARTGLNDKTVTNVVDELIKHGLVHETGQRASTGGRPAVELAVDPTARFVVGVDLAHAGVTAALVDLAGRLHRRVGGPPLPDHWRAEHTVPTASQAVDNLLESVTPDRRNKIVGIGIGAPTLIKFDRGHYYGRYRPVGPGWVDLGPADAMSQRFGWPTTMDGNAQTSTLAEQWFGAGRGVANFVLVNLSLGLGAGIVVGGDFYRGANQRAGGIAHISVADEPPCPCGNSGCLQSFASVRAVLDAARALIAAGEPSVLRDRVNLSFIDVVEAYHHHDPVATTVFADVIHYLAKALVTLIHTYDPSMILIGRDLATAGAPFFGQLRTAVRNRLDDVVRDEIRIEPASVPDEPVIGAATLALREFFRAPLDRLPPGVTPSSERMPAVS